MQKIVREGEPTIVLTGLEIDVACEAVDEARLRTLSPLKRRAANKIIDILSNQITARSIGEPLDKELRLQGQEACITLRALSTKKDSDQYQGTLDVIHNQLFNPGAI